MGLFVNQQDRRSELQERIAAELREKAKASGLQEKASLDGVEDVKYLENTKQTEIKMIIEKNDKVLVQV